MFQRYKERARRVIFVARYEAAQLGSTTIETQHLLLGLLREDRNLTNRFLGDHSFTENIRAEIERQATVRQKVSHSIDRPLSDQCKRILAYAVEEADLLSHPRIGTEHLLLGILREEKCVAAQILNERGLRLNKIREELALSPFPLERPGSVIPDPPVKNEELSDESDEIRLRRAIRQHELSHKMLDIQKGIEEAVDELIASLPPEERAEFIKELAEEGERFQNRSQSSRGCDQEERRRIPEENRSGDGRAGTPRTTEKGRLAKSQRET